MEDDKIKAIEELREIYQNIQDENERFRNEDGYGQYTSDGEWLDQFLPVINKLLE